MRPELTPRQAEAFDFIRSHLKQKGFPPTLREIGKQMGVRSTNAVNDLLVRLERKGYISRVDVLTRGIKVLVDLAPPAADPRADELTQAARDLQELADSLAFAGAPETALRIRRIAERIRPPGD